IRATRMRATRAATPSSAKWSCKPCARCRFARCCRRFRFTWSATTILTRWPPARQPERMPMPTVVISPFNVVNFPEGGGLFWVYMQYALGLRQLGCDVYWLECFHSRGDEASDQALLAPFRARMERFGLGGKLILYPMTGPNREPALSREFAGMSALEA